MSADRGTNEARGLLSAWADRCRAAGADPAPCTGPDARFLVAALGAALRQGSQTPELGRAARSWGARFSAPVDALAALAALREVGFGAMWHADAAPAASELPVDDEAANHLFDQVMLEAIDAASTNLRTQARTDHLTGCANRLAFTEDLSRATTSAVRSGLDLAVATVDLDGLKRINDTSGHAAGDEALKGLVALLQSELRDADTLYRTGGDEFVVIAPFTDAAGATAMLGRASARGGTRFSWGIATLKGVGQAGVGDPGLLLAAADADLYVRRRFTRRHRRRLARSGRSAAGALAGGLVATSRRSRAAVASSAASVRETARCGRRGIASATASVGLAASRGRAAFASSAPSPTSLVAGAKRHRVLIASCAAAVLLLVATMLTLGDGTHRAPLSRTATRPPPLPGRIVGPPPSTTPPPAAAGQAAPTATAGASSGASPPPPSGGPATRVSVPGSAGTPGGAPLPGGPQAAAAAPTTPELPTRGGSSPEGRAVGQTSSAGNPTSPGNPSSPGNTAPSGTAFSAGTQGSGGTNDSSGSVFAPAKPFSADTAIPAGSLQGVTAALLGLAKGASG